MGILRCDFNIFELLVTVVQSLFNTLHLLFTIVQSLFNALHLLFTIVQSLFKVMYHIFIHQDKSCQAIWPFQMVISPKTKTPLHWRGLPKVVYRHSVFGAGH